MVRIKGICWGGTKVSEEQYEATAKFFTEVMGFKPYCVQDGAVIFQLPNSDIFETVSPRQAVELNGIVSGPKIDFLVYDVAETRREMEKLGVKFEGPIQSNSDQSWTHFWAPDGHLYGLTDMLGHPDHAV